MSATAKLRTGLQAALCWHRLQDPSFFQNGAQKLLAVLHGALFARSSTAIAGAEIAETRRALRPVGETAKIRTGLLSS